MNGGPNAKQQQMAGGLEYGQRSVMVVIGSTWGLANEDTGVLGMQAQRCGIRLRTWLERGLFPGW
jgi:hypothetical protein